eukprot:m.3427 g.3427  ORF g.3427 m.3427 type:complete len:1084 (+) comp2768_c0_seq2:200-3451(+)
MVEGQGEAKPEPVYMAEGKDGQAMWLNPIFSSITSINVYGTPSRLYVVGVDHPSSPDAKFRLLQIDRTSRHALKIVEDGLSYTPQQINELILMIDAASGPKHSVLGNRQSAYGILGFVRFLYGYYMILITRRRIVGLIGKHAIYKIEDTFMFAVNDIELVGQRHLSEQRYIRMFRNVDLSSNFYYSYTYDLTRPLQANMHPPTPKEVERGDCSEPVRSDPDREYVWNDYLLKPFESQVQPDWCIYVVHGFIAQSNINVIGRPIYVTLIARRSKYFAGARFLKRGCDSKGHPANCIETEQIVHDASTSFHGSGKYTSWLQMRASVPCYWSQDLATKIRPPILIDRRDPFASAAAIHFDRLISKYGSPIIVLDLVKKKEKRPREAILAAEFSAALAYLNQFMPKNKRIRRIAWDMHRTAKSKNGDVLEKLDVIAQNTLKETGIFHAGPQLECNKNRPGIAADTLGGLPYGQGSIGRNQSGIVRVNCVDCLDRTNMAQFMLGLGALRVQMYTLGLLEDPKQLQLDSPAFHVLEELYEDLGDTVALQYGGSQLVNRIQTYRKTSPWRAHSRDILNTVARAYSNSFTDFEKQGAMNLLLGVFQPDINKPDLWHLESDRYLHIPELKTGPVYRPHYMDWCTAIRNQITPQIELCRQMQPEDAVQRQDRPLATTSPVSMERSQQQGEAKELSATETIANQTESESAPVNSDENNSFRLIAMESPSIESPIEEGEIDLPELEGNVQRDYMTIRNSVVEETGCPLEMFDVKVRQLIESWGTNGQTPRRHPETPEFLTASLLVAAREGLHFKRFTKMPRMTAEPQVYKKSGCYGTQVNIFYVPHSLVELERLYPVKLGTMGGSSMRSPFKKDTRKHRTLDDVGDEDGRSEDEDSEDDDVDINFTDMSESKKKELPRKFDTEQIIPTSLDTEDIYGFKIRTAKLADLELFNKYIDIEGFTSRLTHTMWKDGVMEGRLANVDPRVPALDSPKSSPKLPARGQRMRANALKQSSPKLNKRSSPAVLDNIAPSWKSIKTTLVMDYEAVDPALDKFSAPNLRLTARSDYSSYVELASESMYNVRESDMNAYEHYVDSL